ncbi:MAG TPA: CpsD/CapB family tyrosine-protein kinase [Oscillospiraceae bacterium]|nr:CpsD/CapB family tyrosine-protein kinase [Oscillospiraceae bacterium]
MRKKRKKTTNPRYAERLITFRNPKSPVSEAFRTVRTNIEFSDIDHKLKTIMVTSSIPSEGKSTLTSNIAVAMAMSGKNILIIDADLRSPTQHKCFNVRNLHGLTNLLLDETLSLEDVLVYPSQENLILLTTGPLPPNPAELLGSERMRNFVASLANHFDVILIDAPPVLPVTDAAILASYVDGVVMVAAAGNVPREQALLAKEQLIKAKANILGVVLNKVSANSKPYYGYYGHSQ